MLNGTKTISTSLWIVDIFYLPVLHALQGHPEAAHLWEEHISKILCDIGFVSTTHEFNIYSATIDNHKILLLHEVDDFIVAMPDPAMADHYMIKLASVCNSLVKPPPRSNNKASMIISMV
jgi:hypothetical protein